MISAADPSTIALVDWPSLTWIALLAALSLACLTVKARFERIAESGRLAEVLAHVAVGYFGVGLVLFGATSAFQAWFPVPGGAAWEGGVAVLGGLAAVTIGATTLFEHLANVVQIRHAAREPVAVTQGARN